MKLLRTIVLFDEGNVVKSKDWKDIYASISRSIDGIRFPEGSSKLILRKKERRPGGQFARNGVGYLRSRFLYNMTQGEGWVAETDVNLSRERQEPLLTLYPSLESYREPITSDFGGFDFTTTTQAGLKFAIEWETGNISSSHRSMNKLAIALGNKLIAGGVLIVPSKALYEHLTDRIGNIGELSGYLSLWQSMRLNVQKGLLAIAVVEHDSLTDDQNHPFLPVGNDGRAREGRSRA